MNAIIDNSMLKDTVCSTRAALRHALGRRAKSVGLPLVRGSALHAAIAAWLEGDSIDDAVARFTQLYRARWEAAEQAGETTAEEPWHWKSSARILRHLLAGWEEKPLPYTGEPGLVEVALVKKELLPGVDFVALLDWVVRSSTGTRWLLDWKTKRSLTPWFAEQERTSSQYVGQMFAAAETGLEAAGALAVGLEFGTLNSSEKKCKAHGMAYRECALLHVKAPVIVTIQPTAAEIASWTVTAQRLTRKLLRIKERVNSVEQLRELPQEGRFWGACAFCDYKEYCQLGRPENWVDRMTVEEWWNPLAEAAARGKRRERTSE
jgi:hypothetical protein